MPLCLFSWTAFPLNAVTLGNNLMVSFVGYGSAALGPEERWFNLVCPARWRQHFCKDSPVYAALGDGFAEQSERTWLRG